MPTSVTVTASIADAMNRYVRLANRRRAQMLASAEGQNEWAAKSLLHYVYVGQAVRISALAESTGSDASTISRQVATLVKEGLVERTADPQDGRASLLVITPAGEAVVAAQRRRRDEFFDEVLADWSDGDRTTFSEYLERFINRFENHQLPVASAATERISR
jgi:DNA-binding MarR family transcriptional regulator